MSAKIKTEFTSKILMISLSIWKYKYQIQVW